MFPNVEVLCIIVISTCLFANISCEDRPHANEIQKGRLSETSADVIMKEDAEEIFYNVDVRKYIEEGVRCQPASSPENGYLVGGGTEVGSVVYFKCHEGFWLSGPAIMVCTAEKGRASWYPVTVRQCKKGHTFFDEDAPEHVDNAPDTLPTEKKERSSDIEHIPPFLTHKWAHTLLQKDETDVEEETGDERLRKELQDRMPEMCIAKPDVGPCKAILPRYYFDAQKMECSKFYYGGCGGNRNRFESIDDCVATCRGLPELGHHIREKNY